MSAAITITDPAIGTTASLPNTFDAMPLPGWPASMMRAAAGAAPGTGCGACSHSPQRRQASSVAGASSAATTESAAIQFAPHDDTDAGDVLP